MSEIAIATPETAVLGVFTDLKSGKIDDAITRFAKDFTFKDYGIALEFKDKERLAKFFYKSRELYPGAFLQADAIFVSNGRVIIEWTLQFTLAEPFYGRLSRKVQVLLNGVSIVQTANGKIIKWVDYYDGWTSRRLALASYFTEWAEL